MGNCLIVRKAASNATEAFGGGYNTGSWQYTNSIYCPKGVMFIGVRHCINDSRVISGVGYDGSNDNKTFTDILTVSGSGYGATISTDTNYNYKYYRAKYYANWENTDSSAMAGVKAIGGVTRLLNILYHIFNKEVCYG